MKLGNIELSKKSTLYFFINIIILTAFLFFPWLKITNYFSLTAASGFFRIFGLTNINSELNEYLGDGLNYIYSLAIYALTWYVILIFLIISFYQLFLKTNIREFNKFSRIGYIADLITCGILVIFRFTITSYVSSSLQDYNAFLGSYAGSLVGGIISLGFGFYIIVILSIIGLFLNRFIEEPDNSQPIYKPNDSIPFKIKSNLNLNPKSEITQPESEVNKTPKLNLTSSTGENLKITELPALIGKNRNEVNYYLDNDSISPVQAEIIEYEGDFLIIDHYSKYGTYLDNKKLIPGEFYKLENGDTIKLGTINFQVDFNSKKILNNNVSVYKGGLGKEPVEEVFVKENSNENLLATNNISEESSYNQTLKLGDGGGFNETIKINYNGGSSDFPLMSLKSLDTENIYMVNKTPFYIGSDKDRVDLVLNDLTISKRHVNIERINDKFYLTDLNSTNGTYLNDTLLKTNSQTLLNPGDIIKLGEKSYIFEQA